MDILEFAKSDLLAKGFIDQNLLAMGTRAHKTFHPQFLLFGIKGGALMVMPIINIQTFKYNEVRYYPKESLEIKMSGFTQILNIRYPDGTLLKYGITQNRPEIHQIVDMLNS